MAQKFVQKTRSKIDSRSRQERYASQDTATDRVIEDALKASKRARKLLRELKAL